MSAAFNKFNQFVADLANKVHNLGADNLKIMLSNLAPVATNAVKADITEIAGGGYIAGGAQAVQISSVQIGGLEALLLNAANFVANTGPIGPFRYFVFYNSTPASGPLIGWWDFGSSTTLIAGSVLQVTFDPISGALTVQ